MANGFRHMVDEMILERLVKLSLASAQMAQHGNGNADADDQQPQSNPNESQHELDGVPCQHGAHLHTRERISWPLV